MRVGVRVRFPARLGERPGEGVTSGKCGAGPRAPPQPPSATHRRGRFFSGPEGRREPAAELTGRWGGGAVGRWGGGAVGWPHGLLRARAALMPCYVTLLGPARDGRVLCRGDGGARQHGQWQAVVLDEATQARHRVRTAEVDQVRRAWVMWCVCRALTPALTLAFNLHPHPHLNSSPLALTLTLTLTRCGWLASTTPRPWSSSATASVSCST